jgi:hypothetical protein
MEPQSQPRTEFASILTKLVQLGRFNASVIKSENRQSITRQNNQEAQEKEYLQDKSETTCDKRYTGIISCDKGIHGKNECHV